MASDPHLRASDQRPSGNLTAFFEVERRMSRLNSDVYLLGAGFARAISPTMPLLQDLADRILKSADDALRMPPEARTLMEENFGHALSYLEQSKPWLTEAENLRHRALFLDVSNAISEVLDEAVSSAAAAMGAQTPVWLNQLLRYWHDHKCTVLTLNYDTLIERVAADLESPEGKITAAHLYPSMLTDAALRSGVSIERTPMATFRLLKLHGSTNWYYSGRPSAYGEPIYFVPPLGNGRATEKERQQHEQRLRAVADKYPFMIPPIYDKSPLLTHETIRALWFSAGEALKQASRLVCMGYSLPESDLTMMHFLRTTCAPDTRIEIVNEAENAVGNFTRLFGATDVAVELSASGTDCIETFVKHLKSA